MLEEKYENTAEKFDEAYEKVLREGGNLFEKFYLRPKKYNDRIVNLRMRVNKKWSGWQIKDEVVKSLGLEVGDTIATEVTPYFTNGIIEDENTDLFASDKAVDWLLEKRVNIGSIIDCKVRFAYTQVPVGIGGKMIYKISLVLEEGIAVVGEDEEYILMQRGEGLEFGALLKSILS